MAINLAIRVSHPDATSVQIKYARVDNVSTPTYTLVSPNPAISDEVSTVIVATNVANGQYRIDATPIVAPGTVCDTQTIYTDACPGLIAINASIAKNSPSDDYVLTITWTAPVGIPQTRITVNYPNGGQSVQNYVNSTSTMSVTVPVPPGNVGTFNISGQSVCDPVSEFYSTPSATVSVSNNSDETTGSYQVLVENNTTTLTITSITGIPGVTLTNIEPESSRIGTRTGNTSTIYAYFNVDDADGKHMELTVNGDLYQCKDFHNSPAYFLIPLGLTGSEDIIISIEDGTCS